jgi:16S rRNA (guanine(966)-N(2))-methyltransferase RsmD
MLRPFFQQSKVFKVRIVSGSARGKKLVPFVGDKIRPTSDRIREAIFSSLSSRMGSLEGCSVLDLFAGTGALGIEALSRGASSATFVDNTIQAVRVIHKNLENCGFLERAGIIQKDVFECWPQLHEAGPFDVIFVDPPYGKGLVEKTVKIIAAEDILASQGILCLETPASETIPEKFFPLMLLKTSRYGSTRIFLFKASDEGDKK